MLSAGRRSTWHMYLSGRRLRTASTRLNAGTDVLCWALQGVPCSHMAFAASAVNRRHYTGCEINKKADKCFSCIHCEKVTCFQIVNALHDTECLNHIRASSPVKQAVQVQGYQTVLIAPVPKVWYQSCCSSLCIFQLGNINFKIRPSDAVRVVNESASHQ